jgi:hypothetical protein
MVRAYTIEWYSASSRHPTVRSARVAVYCVKENAKGKLIWRRETAYGWHNTETDRGLLSLWRDEEKEKADGLVRIDGLSPNESVKMREARKVSGVVGKPAMDWVYDNV